MTLPSSELLARRRDLALEQEDEMAALLFQLHLLREKRDVEELSRLFFLLPETIAEESRALSFTMALQALFAPGSHHPIPRLPYPPSELLLIALLLREECKHFSPEEGRKLLASINHYFRADLQNEGHWADLLLLYEALQVFDDVPDILVRLYTHALAPQLETLISMDAPSVSDLLLMLGPIYGGETGADLFRRCIDLRALTCAPGSSPMLAAKFRLMDLLSTLGKKEEALALGAEILTEERDDDENRLFLCSTSLLRADIRLDRLETAGVEEDLHTAQRLYELLDPTFDEDASLSFHLHTAFVRYYFLNTADAADTGHLEYHAQQAYALALSHDFGPENTLAAINNLIFPLSYTGRFEEAAAILDVGLTLIQQEGMEDSPSAITLYTSAALVNLDDRLPPQARQIAAGLQDDGGDPVLSFWTLFHRASQILEGRSLPEEALIQARGLVIRCERLLGRFCREVSTASISLKRLRALLFFRQGDRDQARYWTFSAISDAREHPHLHPFGTLFNFFTAFSRFLPDILIGPELKALLDELCAGMPERIRRILTHRDESYILQALSANTVLINFMLALSEQGEIFCTVEELYALVINGKSIYSRLLRLNKAMRSRNPQNEPLYRQLDDLREGILAEQTSEMLRGEGWDVYPMMQEKRLLELSLEEDIPATFRWLSCEEVLSRLPDGAALVDYYAYPANRSGDLFLTDMRYAVFAAYRVNGQLYLKRLPSLNFLEVRWNLLLVTAEARASRFRTLAQGLGSVGHGVLYRKLFHPVAALLDERVHTLFLSPDGELAKLPFGLLGPVPTRRLCDRYTIIYLESARDLKPDITIQLDGQEALVVGNPDFSLTPVDPESVPQNLTDRLVSKIPLTKIEAQMVADKLHTRPLLRRAACKRALQDCTASILHIATHGAFYFDPETDDTPTQCEALFAPMRRACLYFSGANDWLLSGQEDPVLGNGVLTAEELCHYRMKPPQLVVLSACFSGMGDVQQGNGIVGLQTAFKVQGAKAMLLSVWEADDFAAAILMDRFYDNLASMPAGQALRDAQHYVRSVTIAQLGDRQWFDERRFRRIGLVAEDMRKMASRPPNFRPFSHIRYWGGYILYE